MKAFRIIGTITTWTYTGRMRQREVSKIINANGLIDAQTAFLEEYPTAKINWPQPVKLL